MESNSTAFLIKIKLRHSLGRPSRSDFVQSEFLYPKRLLFQSEDLYHACMEETLTLGEKTKGNGTALLKKREQRARKQRMKQKKKSGRSGAFD